MSNGGSEPIGAEDWIVSQLLAEPLITGAVGTNIFWGVAPNKTPFPFITFTLMANSTRRSIGGRILWLDLTYLVQGVDKEGSPTRLVPIANGIYRALDRKRGETDTLFIVSSQRTLVHAPPPVVEKDDLFSMLGGQYRIRVRPK